jgi:competence protein ComEC
MKHFSRFPVLRTLFPFVSGIISADLMELNPAPLLITTIIFGMLSLMFTINHYATGKYASRWLAGFPFFMMFFSMGFALNQFGYRKPDLMSYNFINRELTLLLKLEQPPLRSASGSRFSGKVVALGDSLNWNSVSFKSMIRTRQVPEKLSLYRGDWILVRGWLREVPAPLNPGAFNYQKFLARKGIYFQLFADSLKIEQVHSPQPERSLFWYANEVRHYLLDIIERRYPDPQIRGVAGALLLGYEDWMEPDVEAGFAAAGVLHILCVSGMHVGLIYMILSWTLNKILRRKWTAFMKYPLLIFCIWFYAMVTGFAPSVVRASAMLTVVILGRWTDRNSDITNLLGVSCMVLMIFEPALLFSAGFQLSFLAVCGIVYLSKPIASVWQSKSTLFLKMRDLTAISIAAQLATFPIALLLFHQFPNYFLQQLSCILDCCSLRWKIYH